MHQQGTTAAGDPQAGEQPSGQLPRAAEHELLPPHEPGVGGEVHDGVGPVMATGSRDQRFGHPPQGRALADVDAHPVLRAAAVAW